MKSRAETGTGQSDGLLNGGPGVVGRMGLLSVIVLVASAGWSVAMFPQPAALLRDADHGYQLAGAMQILQGEHPFVNFRDIYGPFVYYASAAAQWLSSGRVIGELVLLTIAYAATYVLLLRLMVAMGVNRRIALAAILVALSVLPDAYRYYLVLTPVVFLSALNLYTSGPNSRRLLGLAASISFAGLFRPDIGCYTLIAASLAIAHAHWNSARPYIPVGALWTSVLLISSPWLLWLAHHDSFFTYLYASSVDAIRAAPAIALPFDPFETERIISSANARAYMVRAPYLLGALGVVFAAIGWRQLPTARRSLLLGVLAYATCSLLMISHRSDWAHCRDVYPVFIAIVAWCISQRQVLSFSLGRRNGTILWAAGVAAGIAMLIPLRWIEIEHLRPSAMVEKISTYRSELDTVIDAVRREEPGNPEVRAIGLIRQHTYDTDRVFTLYGHPNVNYFARRPFAGGQLALYPGYFSTVNQQADLLNTLRRQPVGMVLFNDVVLDERPERALSAFARDVCDYLEQEFVVLDSFGTIKILRPRSALTLPYGSRPAKSFLCSLE